MRCLGSLDIFPHLPSGGEGKDSDYWKGLNTWNLVDILRKTNKNMAIALNIVILYNTI